jgi:Holliday junction resolvase
MNNRQRGHTWEREVCNLLKEKFPNVKVATSRYVSRELDDLKVDVVTALPIAIQCKLQATGVKPSIKIDGLLDCIANAPAEQGTPVLVTKLTRRSKTGKTFQPIGEFVTLRLDDYLDLLSKTL